MVDDVGDVTLVVIVKHLENFEMYSCKAINQVRLKSPGLTLAKEITEVNFTTKQYWEFQILRNDDRSKTEF